jgi:hypothetical protein
MVTLNLNIKSLEFFRAISIRSHERNHYSFNLAKELKILPPVSAFRKKQKNQRVLFK